MSTHPAPIHSPLLSTAMFLCYVCMDSHEPHDELAVLLVASLP